MSVLEAADPIGAARAAAAEAAQQEHQQRIDDLRSAIAHAQAELSRLETNN